MRHSAFTRTTTFMHQPAASGAGATGTPDSIGGARDDAFGIGMFEEPADYYEAEPPYTFASHTLRDGTALRVRLVGRSPLWGHLLWNAGRMLSSYIEERSANLVLGKTVLELGAGAGLPSLVCAKSGAVQVVVTDYPDVGLIDNLHYNICECIGGDTPRNITELGHVWGSAPTPLLSKLPRGSHSLGFDLLVLADLVFNHSEHTKLLSTVTHTLKRTPESRALVFFTPYRPWLLDRDLAFFDLAQDSGFDVDKVLETCMENVMFDKDPGDETLRRTVFGYEMRWKAAFLKTHSHSR